MASYSSNSKEEKQGLTQSFKSQVGYGTAVTSASSKKSVPKSRKLISKKVSRTDTLIGIALKYGVTVQNLKRENRLWTNDSLFLRESLLIPLTSDNESALDPEDIVVLFDGNTQTLVQSQQSTSSASSQSSSPSPHHHNGTDSEGKSRNVEHESDSAILEVETSVHSNSNAKPTSFSSLSLSSSSSSSNNKTSRSSSSSALSSPSSSSLSSNPLNGKARSVSAATASPGSDLNPSHGGGDAGASADFFSKYDLNIAKLKGNVAKLENKTSTNALPFLDENPLALPSPKNSRRSSTGSSTSSGRRFRRASSPPRVATLTYEDEENTSGTGHSSPVLMIRSRTNQKLIKSTLERSRQASDEIFEL